uniref:2-Cys peroxiredoxin BAS1 n=1 Tax=Rhizochromulina marina TaxID=1034831 RepID=A0A514CPR5_9STRA|nr:2-Cys peroxiredoxin BAS1 [Rhizochromulina marina]QDH81799.1 2-Cys peroxiredoxin BAS1 [Rhizochromulina marina]
MFNPTYQNTKKIESPLLQTYRSKIRLKDYQGKKNIFLLFLPGNLSGRSQRLQNSILELNENFNKFVENETEILIVVQSFSPEVRWNLNLAKVHGGLRNLKFPIIFDPWGLLFNSYNSQNDSKQKGKIETYTSYFINKEGIIRYIGYFDQQIKFDLPKTLEIIESLRS